MQPDSADTAYLRDMLKFARELVTITTERPDAPELQELIIRRATERVTEILGEAARRVSDPFRLAHPEIDWRGIIGLRTLLAHEYSRVDYARVSEVAAEHVPPLIATLQSLLQPEPE
jgi:uncharacterized protein with HEPN domain